MSEARAQARSRRGALARLAGRRREVVAMLLLMAKGYRILGFRLRTAQGEIDLLAAKAGCLVVVEVKSRTTLEAALDAVRPDQQQRLRRAARAIAAGRPAFRQAPIRLDLIAFAPRRWPRHVCDAWRHDV